MVLQVDRWERAVCTCEVRPPIAREPKSGHAAAEDKHRSDGIQKYRAGESERHGGDTVLWIINETVLMGSRQEGNDVG